jgi:hypothetical protein
VGANVIRLLSLGFPGEDGLPARLTVQQHSMKFRRLPMLGDSLAITCTKHITEQGLTKAHVHVVDKATSKDVMIADLLLSMH